MTFDLTRRHFGLACLATTFVNIPGSVWCTAYAYANPSLLVDPADLAAQLPTGTGSQSVGNAWDLVVVDVRPREDFDAGHIPGARHLDPNGVVARHSPVDGALQSISDLETLLSGLGLAANRRIVFYDDKGGFHAARMLWLMEYLGHRDVAILNGGWSGWRAAKKAVSKMESVYHPASFQAAVSPRRHASAADVLAHRNEPNSVLIDVRPEKLYAKGHIPWAINIPWSRNLGEDGRFLGEEALRAHFAAHGVTPESNVIMHCQIGLASSHSYVALRLLGFPQVRVYHRSWAEWNMDPALPKATS